MDRDANPAQQAPAGNGPAQVKISNLNKTFHRGKEAVHVLRDISLEIAQGELLVLLGPSGCGKTTLLRCLVGLEKPGQGRVELGDTTVVDADARVFVQPNKRDVAMVFQNYALWPHMKVAANVAYPLKARKMKDELKNGRVHEVLQVVQCDHLADRYPPELSGGQQQRISLARALAPRPALLLLDEPLSNLDALLRIELRAQLRLLHRELGFTGVYVTHDQEEALALGTRVAVMKEGQFEQIGPPAEVYSFPATEYVADFLGARNRLELHTEGDGRATVAGVPLEGFVRPGLGGRFALRLRDADPVLRVAGTPGDEDRHWITGAELIEVLPAGDHAEHVVRLGDQTLFVDVPATRGVFEPGAKVDIGLATDSVLCYDADGRLVRDWAAI
ncbi:ABC transporter ATP-binding protein [Nocardioides jishulii]|uniref:ABC transporter ATP-binding protein n=2 Tax=Nocardioides jishulii TaxID=2575440 RepID=A0A4U2YTH3_9ACTN|nr:ABC transporter ATP-binding protein [Nocardioides jishulii]TKI64836.1 ABC transporter ATP-binding protein [Nocardioides jishulii]